MKIYQSKYLLSIKFLIYLLLTKILRFIFFI